jgi:hypothetical protein
LSGRKEKHAGGEKKYAGNEKKLLGDKNKLLGDEKKLLGDESKLLGDKNKLLGVFFLSRRNLQAKCSHRLHLRMKHQKKRTCHETTHPFFSRSLPDETPRVNIRVWRLSPEGLFLR